MAVKKKVVEIDTKTAQTSVRDLRNLLKLLKDTMLSTEKGTEEYNDALRKSADIMHTLKEQNEELNASAMDFGQIASNCTKTVGGLVGGLLAAKAMMTLFGVENEDVIKSLQKMQSLMAITQALPAIDNAIKAFKRLSLVIQAATGATQGFKAALVSTGLGALVVVLGTLVANWDKVTEAMRKWGIISEDTKEKLAEQKKKVEELNGEIAKLQGTYADWEKKNKISKLNSEAKKSYEDLENTIEGLNIKLQESVVKREKENKEQQRGWRERWKTYNEEGLAILENIRVLKNQQRAILDDANSYKELDKETKKHTDSVKIDTKWLQELMGYLANLRESMAKTKKELSMLDESEEEDEAFLKKADEVRTRIENTVNSLRNAFMTPEEQYDKEINALEVALNTKLIKEEEYLKLRDALNKEQAQREISRYALAANSIGTIFSSLGDMMEEGSKEQKALQIMGATINMLGGITAAIAGAFTTHSGPWDIALAALQAAAIAASGAATIAKMSKTNMSNASSMAGSRPASTAIAQLNAPVQYTQDVQGSEIEGALRDTRVYVVESDIANTHHRVNVTENEAKF